MSAVLAFASLPAPVAAAPTSLLDTLACSPDIALRQHWPAALAGTVVHAPCPAGSVGDMTRLCCGADLHGAADVMGYTCTSLSHGTWLAPSPVACRSLPLADQAQALTTTSSIIATPTELLQAAYTALDAAGGAIGAVDVINALTVLDAALAAPNPAPASLDDATLDALVNLSARAVDALLHAHGAPPATIDHLLSRLVPLANAAASRGRVLRLASDSLVAGAVSSGACAWPSADLAATLRSAGDVYTPTAALPGVCRDATPSRAAAAVMTFAPSALPNTAAPAAALASDQLVVLHGSPGSATLLQFPVVVGAPLRLGLRNLLRTLHPELPGTISTVQLAGVMSTGHLRVQYGFVTNIGLSAAAQATAADATDSAANATAVGSDALAVAVPLSPQLAGLTLPARLSCRQRLGVDTYDPHGAVAAPLWTEAGCVLVNVSTANGGVHVHCRCTAPHALQGSTTSPPVAYGAFIELEGGSSNQDDGTSSSDGSATGIVLSAANLRLVTLVVLMLAVVAASVTLLGLLWVWRRNQLTTAQQVVLNLCLALIITAVLHVAAIDTEALSVSAVGVQSCKAGSAALSHVALAALLWHVALLTTEAMRYWRPHTPPETLLPLLSIVCWLLPIAPVVVAAVIPTLSTTGPDTGKHCWRPLGVSKATGGDLAATLAPLAFAALTLLGGLTLALVLLCVTRLPTVPVLVGAATLLQTAGGLALLAWAAQGGAPAAGPCGALLLLLGACVLFHRFCLRDTDVYDSLRDAPLGFVLPERKRTPYKMRLESPVRRGSVTGSPHGFLNHASRSSSNNGSRTSLFTSASARSNSSPQLVAPSVRPAYAGFASPARAGPVATEGQLALAAASIARSRTGPVGRAQDEADYAYTTSRTFEALYGVGLGGKGSSGLGLVPVPVLPAPVLVTVDRHQEHGGHHEQQQSSPSTSGSSGLSSEPVATQPVASMSAGHASPRANPFNTTAEQTTPTTPTRTTRTAGSESHAHLPSTGLTSPTRVASWRASREALDALDALEAAAASAASVARGATSSASSSPQRPVLQRARSSPYFAVGPHGGITPNRSQEDAPVAADLRGRTVRREGSQRGQQQGFEQHD